MARGVPSTDTAQARKILEEELYRHMTLLGFSLERSNYRKLLNEQTTLWVGVQVTENQRPLIGLFPRVGFYNHPVTEFLRTRVFAPEVGTQPLPPTLTWTVGYLMPERQPEWVFEPVTERVLESVRIVVGAIEKYGVPAMSKYPSTEALLAWAEAPQRDPQARFFQRDLLRAAVYYLNDQRAKASQCIMERIAAAEAAKENLDDPGHAPYLRFRSLLAA